MLNRAQFRIVSGRARFFLFFSCAILICAFFASLAFADAEPESITCAKGVAKAHSAFSKFEIATVCQGTSHVDETIKCLNAANADEDLDLTQMWTAQLCGRNGPSIGFAVLRRRSKIQSE